MNNTFTINVLSPGQKKRVYSEAHKILFLLLPILVWTGLMYGLYLLFYIPTYEKIQSQQRILAEYNMELTQLNALQSKLERQKALYLLASNERIDWSPKLISFSLLIPKDVWITKLIYSLDEGSKEKSPLLEIYGQTASLSNRESLDKIAIFIEGVNKESSFRQNFSPLEFIYSQLQEGEDRVMNFKLSSLAKIAQKGDIP